MMSADNLFPVMIWQKEVCPKTKLVSVATCSLVTLNGIKSLILSSAVQVLYEQCKQFSEHFADMNASPSSSCLAIAQRLDHLPQELANSIFVVPNPDFGH